MSGFICPVCREKLEAKDKSLVCRNKHTFDIAKQGYVNLLLSNQMNAKLPGDNKMMVSARRNFLNKGYYKILSEKLCDTAVRYIKNGDTVLDAGCGEGYYTQKVYESLLEKGIQTDMLGIDISKNALAAAGKRSDRISWAVASIFHIPAADCSCNAVITLFAPYCGEEFQRRLKQGGIMTMVIPGEKHLWSLKKAVYDKPYLNEVKDYALDGFKLIEKEKISGEIFLPCNEDIANLFTMTPYYYKTSEEGQRRLNSLSELTTEIEFEILTYRKDC